MGNWQFSHTWLKVSDKGLDGLFTLVDNLLIDGRDYVQLAERVEALLKRCQKVRKTLASNKVQVGSKVSFAGYIIIGNTQYPDPKKVEAVTKFPLPTTQRELRGWMQLAKPLCIGLGGEHAELRKLLKKNLQFTITDQIKREFTEII